MNQCIPSGLTLTAIRRGLADRYAVRSVHPERQTVCFYDTFEWSLWNSGRLLCCLNGTVQIARRDQGWIGEVELSTPTPKVLPRFATDWQDEAFLALLKPLTGLRALMPVAEITAVERTVELLNPDRKVVFRFKLVNLFETAEARMPFYRLCMPLPLLGYSREAGLALDGLQQLGLAEIEEGSGPFEQHLAGKGRAPAPYTLRPVFGLQPHEPAREAVRIIVHRMLEIGRSQESGIIDDIDTEFLHDYRICLRKIRSVLNLLKDVYPAADTNRLKKATADAAQQTNRLRDLDVYLLNRGAYSGLLPPNLRGGLEPLFERFQHERNTEYLRIRKRLRSAAYRKRMESLEAFFTNPDLLPPSPNSEQPVFPLVSTRIYCRYRRILREGRAVTDATPDAVLHAIRIQCKKLRYLLEFFGELYDQNELAFLLKHLRRLQNSLGRFNDYSVQQVALLADTEKPAEKVCPQVGMSIGGLVVVLHRLQQEERARSHVLLKRFCRADVQRCFRALFKAEEPV